jgi:hypothetical protein
LTFRNFIIYILQIIFYTKKNQGKKMSLKIKYKNLKDLLPYAKNSRKHSESQIKEIAASIKEFGFCNPILISSGNDIVAGHGRALAAEVLGLEQVPTIELGHLSDAQRRAYVIADNRLAEKANWDFELLQLELNDLVDLGISKELLGFSDINFDINLNEDESNGVDNIDSNLDGIISTIKVKCPQDIKDEVLIILKRAILETSLEGVEIV